MLNPKKDNFKTKHISIGMNSNLTASEVHHCELLADIPYRYRKNFQQKCLVNGMTVYKKFQLFVWYKNFNFVRDRNIKIFSSPLNRGLIKKYKMEKGHIEMFEINKFINNTVKLMKKDPYIWIREHSTKKPWIKKK